MKICKYFDSNNRGGCEVFTQSKKNDKPHSKPHKYIRNLHSLPTTTTSPIMIEQNYTPLNISGAINVDNLDPFMLVDFNAGDLLQDIVNLENSLDLGDDTDEYFTTSSPSTVDEIAPFWNLQNVLSGDDLFLTTSFAASAPPPQQQQQQQPPPIQQQPPPPQTSQFVTTNKVEIKKKVPGVVKNSDEFRARARLYFKDYRKSQIVSRNNILRECAILSKQNVDLGIKCVHAKRQIDFVKANLFDLLFGVSSADSTTTTPSPQQQQTFAATQYWKNLIGQPAHNIKNNIDLAIDAVIQQC